MVQYNTITNNAGPYTVCPKLPRISTKLVFGSKLMQPNKCLTASSILYHVRGVSLYTFLLGGPEAAGLSPFAKGLPPFAKGLCICCPATEVP